MHNRKGEVEQMKKLLWAVIIFCILPLIPANAAISDYLILNDIGAFRAAQPQYFFKGEPPTGGPRISDSAGALASAYHFTDHTDKTYIIMHIDNTGVKPSPEVQVTQHVGVDSDKWLLHELDMEFRNYYGIPSVAYTVRTINGNTIFVDAVGGRDYRWISGNKAIKIDYTALNNLSTIPEPLEIVKAYLAKHPSSIKPITLQELRSAANVTKWIKDEMERRLWLCDKWSMQLQLGKVTQKETLKALVEHMTAFLYYRQKYYGISVTNDLTTLDTALRANDGATIKNKHSEYKLWWNAHKGASISLPYYRK